MDSELLPIIMVAVLFVLLLFGYPVAFTLGGVALFFGYFGLDPAFLNLLPHRVWGIMTNFNLIAVPLFIFMGVVLEKSGLAENLLESMSQLFGKLRGGHAYSVVIAGALLAASTGIVGASVVTMGLISLPIMLARGYPKRFSCGLICASGTLGQIIPPSIVLILLGDIMGVSVGELFLAAVVPGMLLVASYMLYSLVYCYRSSEIKDSVILADSQTIFQILLSLLPPGILIVAVLGSIFFGIASPTEAAAVGAGGAMLLAAAYKKLSHETLIHVMRQTVLLSSMVFFILIGATAFGLVFRGLDGDGIVADFVMGLPNGELTFLLIVMALLFVLGCFLDFIEIIFIVVPILVPVIQELGMNPLWFAVVIALNLQTSFLTPPLGFALFYLKGVAPEGITSGDVYRGVLPFVVLQLLVLALVVVCPDVVLWLPRFFEQFV